MKISFSSYLLPSLFVGVNKELGQKFFVKSHVLNSTETTA